RQVRRLDCGLGKAKPLAHPVLVEILLLDRARVVVGEAVEADDGRAAVEEGAREMRPDEPCRAGDERLHANTSRTRSGSRHGRPDASSAACTVLTVADTV